MKTHNDNSDVVELPVHLVTVDEVVDFLTETITTTQITLPIIVNDIRREFPDVDDATIGTALLEYCSYE